MYPSSRIPYPKIVDDASAADKAAYANTLLEWSIKDQQALGIIHLHITDSCQVHIKDTNFSSMAWKLLKDTYSKASPAVIHADFKQAVGFCLSGNSPAREINQLVCLLEQLKSNKVDLSEPVRALILINAIPHKWDAAASHVLLGTPFDLLTIQAVRAAKPTLSTAEANKLSAVKQKVKKLAQFTSNPSEKHLNKAKYICHYLAGTCNYALVYKGKNGNGIHAFTDSD
ncbi:hypothetical protein BYT27DRAFT_7248101 [Phlegmacium glaucopus]|nr:hypothetical protein BYT27DRAFT_7248101 [Phlegmacium glaucopus]